MNRDLFTMVSFLTDQQVNCIFVLLLVNHSVVQLQFQRFQVAHLFADLFDLHPMQLTV